MPFPDAIILAGGLGTRLRSVLPDLPKCMAPVGGRPFIDLLIDDLTAKGVDRLVLAVGYRADAVAAHVQARYGDREMELVYEQEPLGTGGAIRNALHHCRSADVFVLNGDTLFDVDPEALWKLHRDSGAHCTLALKRLQDFDRYGRVELAEDGRTIRAFREKEYCAAGLINGGVYLLDKERFLAEDLPERFSFETDYLARYTDRHRITGLPQEGYFIDIGVPEDLERIRREKGMGQIPTAMSEDGGWRSVLSGIDREWTLFLDRDGVINREKEGDYIRHPEEFEFYPGVPEAIGILSQHFGHVFIVTNQKGIGKGLMTEDDLSRIHARMLDEVAAHGGRIDRIYHCPDLSDDSPCRKPNPGMGWQAQRDFPGVDLQRALMVGNTMGDMRFGKAIGARTLFIPSTKPMPKLPDPLVDGICPGLPALAKSL